MEYKRLYYQLFNAISDSIKAMEEQNFGTAKNILFRAQLESEELYISNCDGEGEVIMLQEVEFRGNGT